MAASGETVNVSRWILSPRAAPSARGSRAIVRRSRHVTARVASRPRSPRGPCRARVGPTARKLKLVEKTIILSVRPDPEPGDLVVLQKADRAISEGHAGGVDGVAIVNLLEVGLGCPGFSRNSRYAFWARFRISGGRSRYAAQKRGVARDLTVCRGRVPSLCRLRARLGPRPRACSARSVKLQTGVPNALRPEIPRAATGRFGPARRQAAS